MYQNIINLFYTVNACNNEFLHPFSATIRIENCIVMQIYKHVCLVTGLYSGFAINAGSIFRPVIKGQRSKLYNSSFFVGSVMTKNLSVDSI